MTLSPRPAPHDGLDLGRPVATQGTSPCADPRSRQPAYEGPMARRAVVHSVRTCGVHTGSPVLAPHGWTPQHRHRTCGSAIMGYGSPVDARGKSGVPFGQQAKQLDPAKAPMPMVPFLPSGAVPPWAPCREHPRPLTLRGASADKACCGATDARIHRTREVAGRPPGWAPAQDHDDACRVQSGSRLPRCRQP